MPLEQIYYSIVSIQSIFVRTTLGCGWTNTDVRTWISMNQSIEHNRLIINSTLDSSRCPLARVKFNCEKKWINKYFNGTRRNRLPMQWHYWIFIGLSFEAVVQLITKMNEHRDGIVSPGADECNFSCKNSAWCLPIFRCVDAHHHQDLL